MRSNRGAGDSRWRGWVHGELALWTLIRGRLRAATGRQFAGRFAFWQFFARADTAARLLVVPRELRTSDMITANDILAGSFRFASHTVEAGLRSPFAIHAPSREWSRALSGFGWLRHLHAANTGPARQVARSLIGDWLTWATDRRSVHWENAVVARRILSWLTHAPLIIEGCEREFYRRYIGALYRQIRWLDALYPSMPPGQERLLCALALTAAGVAIDGQTRLARRALARLDDELGKQILPDGGHRTRNPAVLVDILADLLPLRDAAQARQIDLPPQISRATARMIRLVRFFRLGDGMLAQFNGAGAGATSADLPGKILALDDAPRTALPGAAPHSGFRRLDAEDTTIVMDVGAPPPLAYARAAHAGALAFELTSRQNRLVVNCGSLPHLPGRLRQAARLTAAHSTLSAGNLPSVPVLRGPAGHFWRGAPPLTGGLRVDIEYQPGPAGEMLRAAHNGYVRRLGIVHSRQLTLGSDGSEVEGIDLVETVRTRRRPVDLAIRFHLHPSVKARKISDEPIFLLVCADHETWEFKSELASVQLAESICLSGPGTLRPAQQIVLSASMDPASKGEGTFRTVWRLVRRT